MLSTECVSKDELSAFNANCDRLAVNLFKKFSAAAGEKYGNIVFSPISVTLALGMLYQGAVGSTKTEIKSILANGVDDQTLLTLFGNVIVLLNNESNHFTLSTANRLFVREGIQLRRSFQTTLKDCFKSEAEAIDVSDKTAAVKRINDWVGETTNHKIESIISEHDMKSDFAVLLVNAVYFNGFWKNVFYPESNKVLDFHLLDGTSKKTMFMKTKNSFLYAANNEMEVLGLPYKNDELHMFVFLPRRADADIYFAIEERLSHDRLFGLIDSAEERDVDVRLPKFQVETSAPLKPCLQEIGMNIAFSSAEADFSLAGQNLYLNDAKHKAFIEVNETGTEAAAATAFDMPTGSCMNDPIPPPPLMFTADHPFLYVIRHAATSSLLFFGRLTNPPEAEKCQEKVEIGPDAVPDLDQFVDYLANRKRKI